MCPSEFRHSAAGGVAGSCPVPEAAAEWAGLIDDEVDGLGRAVGGAAGGSKRGILSAGAQGAAQPPGLGDWAGQQRFDDVQGAAAALGRVGAR
jgi:hypothetical protein